MVKREDGFTLIELMVTMVISLIAITATTTIFAKLLTQFKQESRVAESNVEGVIGLEYLRKDTQAAGYGLPAAIPAGVNYAEAATGPVGTNDSTANPPRAVFSLNDSASGLNNSDYLVIKSLSVAVNDDAAGKSATLSVGDVKPAWDVASEQLNPTDRVIVLSTIDNTTSLVASGGAFFTMYNSTSGFAPADSSQVNIVYGVSKNNDLRMPFNRADYFITGAAVAVPNRCAPNTGELVKAAVNQSDGGYTYYPLLDCVADMQVIFGLDTNGDGAVDTWSNDISAFSAATIRQQVREVRVYIVAQEGQMDPSYTSPNPITGDGEFGDGRAPGDAYTLAADQLNYRWKVYTLVEKPLNLR